jgi:hypothetical protein
VSKALVRDPRCYWLYDNDADNLWLNSLTLYAKRHI